MVALDYFLDIRNDNQSYPWLTSALVYLVRSRLLRIGAMPFTPKQKAEFVDCYEKSKSLKEGDKLVSLVYTMIDLSRDAEMGNEVVVPPHQMGIHPKNRMGKKMVPTTMQKKGGKITNVGFRLELCGPNRAVAFEVNPKSNHIEAHTILVTCQSKKFARYEKGALRGGSTGCGHLNQWLAAVRFGAESDFESLCDLGDNKLCARLVTKGNPEYENAVNKGITWFMFKYQMEDDYPELPAIIQRALNIEHHVGEGDQTFMNTSHENNSNKKVYDIRS